MLVGREEEREQEKKRKYKKLKRYTAIGLATIGGGAVLGLTGGLAAPFIGAGLGTIIGTGEPNIDKTDSAYTNYLSEITALKRYYIESVTFYKG